jgi:endoglucanase
MMDLELLRQLCETPGVPGREERVRALIEKTIKGLFDDVRTDTMGSLICTRRAKTTRRTGDAKRVMFAAHMDEIGFYVRHVDDKGFAWVNPAGGFDPRNLFSRRVLVCCDDGDYEGVMNPGGKPIHISTAEERKKVPEVTEFFIDLGMDAKTVAKKVKVGDFVVMNEPFVEQPEKVVSKALDNGSSLRVSASTAATSSSCSRSRKRWDCGARPRPRTRLRRTSASASTRPWRATRRVFPTPSRSPATAKGWRSWCRTRP